MKVLTYLKNPITKSQLNLKNTLQNGQAFNWYLIEKDEYVGIIGNLLIKIQYDEQSQVVYEILNQPSTVEYSWLNAEKTKTRQKALETYFRLDKNLDELIEQWREKDKYFSEINISGLRMVRQEPLECLISFIVSQNNNIKRIGSNLLSIRSTYGTKLGEHKNVQYFQFPTLNQLLKCTSQQLRGMGLGYRAEYIVETAQKLKDLGGADYLSNLIETSPENILEKLLQFKGVGRKVADCVRLFSMGCDGIVPVDTHVYQIYQSRYKKSSTKKKVTSQNYDDVQKEFHSIFGDQAGWAHSFLFAAELPEFKEEVSTKLKVQPKPKQKFQEEVEDENEKQVKKKSSSKKTKLTQVKA